MSDDLEDDFTEAALELLGQISTIGEEPTPLSEAAVSAIQGHLAVCVKCREKARWVTDRE